VIPDPRARLAICREGGIRRYLWLKAVTGVDTDTHCAASLRGRYLGVDRRASEADLVLPPAPAWYFCGVSDPYVWAANDHALILPAPGHTDELYTPGYVLSVENARFQPILTAAIPFGARHAEEPRYRSCRNWRAAHWLARYAGLPDAAASGSR
jgi:hypothetical protein